MACITACSEEEELPEPNSFELSINDDQIEIIDLEVLQSTNGYVAQAYITDSVFLSFGTTGLTTGNYAAGSGAFQESTIHYTIKNGFRYTSYSTRFAPADSPSKIVITSVNLTNQTITGHLSGILYNQNSETLEISGEFHEIPYRSRDVSQNSDVNFTLESDPWTADNIGFNIHGDYCYIIGVGEREETLLSIRVPISAEPGSYSIDGISDYSIGLDYDFQRREYSMLNGMVHIDRNLRDVDILEGRFEFLGENGLDTITVNDGMFRIVY